VVALNDAYEALRDGAIVSGVAISHRTADRAVNRNGRNTVSEPLIFVFNVALQEGMFEDYKAYAAELIEFIEKNEPRLISFEIYANDEGTKPRTYSFTRTLNLRTSTCRSRLTRSTKVINS
jgi:hypothetical protein